MPVSTPGLTDKDAEYVGSLFSIDIKSPKGKPTNEFFREITGLGYEITVVDIEETTKDGKTMTRKRPGQTEFGDIVLKRTLSPDKTFWNWAKDIRDGVSLNYRTAGTIRMHDMTGKVTGQWEFQNAWVSKWSASDLDVGSDDPIIEEVTLAVESIKRIQ